MKNLKKIGFCKKLILNIAQGHNTLLKVALIQKLFSDS